MHEEKPDGESGELLRRILPERRAATGAESRDRLLQCIACDYGTHALLIEALVEMLVNKGLMTEDEFEELLETIDKRDGRIDGTLAKPAFLGEGI